MTRELLGLSRLFLSLRHDLCFRKGSCVGQRQVETADAECSSVFFGFAVQHDLRA